MSKYLFLVLVFFTLDLAHEVKLPQDMPEVKVLMFVTEESHHRTETAITMAKSLLSSGHKVFLVLEGPAVKLVDKGHRTNLAYRKKLLEVVELGGEVYACPYWGRKLRVKGLLEGTGWANPQVIFPKLADEKTRVLVW
ncbi:MAG: DsrE family protein [Aquificaceae bacterium]|nr:DsrE family protein [Aquificaceae bacterium]